MTGLSEAFGSASLPTTSLVYIAAAAGGNAYLQPHTHLTLAGLAAGEGLAALSAAAVQQLMRQLASLAAPLAAFAVQLRR